MKKIIVIGLMVFAFSSSVTVSRIIVNPAPCGPEDCVK
jgi:hypothetical protein